jgi:hypothetical protein
LNIFMARFRLRNFARPLQIDDLALGLYGN